MLVRLSFRLSPGLAAVVVVAVLVLLNVVDIRVPHASLVAGPVCVAALTVLSRFSGLSWQDLGLGPGTWRRGLRWAGVVILIVGVVIAAGALLPVTRDAFRDTRYRLDLGSALLTAFVLIPVGTVLVEEMAFRSVLWGLLARARGTGPATVISSVLFGLWHVLPSLRLASDNSVVKDAVGGSSGQGPAAQVLAVLGAVVFTALSGVVFCELRRRSGSVLASAGLHWATNALSVLASASIWAWGTR